MKRGRDQRSIAKIVLLAVILLLPENVAGWIELSQELLARIKREHGETAEKRLLEWQLLSASGKNLSDKEKLQRVNDFVNENIRFVDDIIQWHKEDYWATPLELLSVGAGDCEDFAIAKYFTLKELGVDENKMRITYVKALQLNQAHMVLTYFDTPKAVPLVLDNLDFDIKPATKRNDLLPVYSFNGTGLWVAKARNAGTRVGDSGRLSLWSDLQSRMLQKP